MEKPIKSAERLRSLPPYLFVQVDRAKRDLEKKGVPLIDLGVGDPDLAPPPFVIQALKRALKDPQVHRYPLDLGVRAFREAVSRFYRRRYSVSLDPDSEILPLIGSKDGLTHMPLALVNPGDRVLIPDPAYPAYRSAVRFAGGIEVPVPLRESNGFLPDWEEVKPRPLSRIKMLYLNYPNNPTSVAAPMDFFKATLRWAQKNGILVCQDAAYAEIYDRKKPVSILQAPGAKESTVEFHSLSKMFNMTGWRLGFVCGNREMIAALARLKSYIDSGVFSAIQWAGAEALERALSYTEKLNRIYRRRRRILKTGLMSLGFRVIPSETTFYVWCGLPAGFKDSIGFCKRLLQKGGLVATPGRGFGIYGEGYIRFSLTASESRIRQALRVLKKVLRR